MLAATDPDFDLARLTTKGLFANDGRGNVVPDLVEKWELSPDQKTYRLTLRPNLHWSDGVPLTTADVIFTFQSLQDKTLASPWAASFRDVTFKSQDERTLNLNLREPYAPFLGALTIGLIPEHIWRNLPPNRWLLAETNLKPVGTGPFRFKSLTTTNNGQLKSYTLEPNPYTHTNQPYLERIILRFYSDRTTALEALRQGAVDGLGGVGSADKEAASPKKFSVHELTLPHYTAIFYNPEKNPWLQEKAIRQGLSYAINRPELVRQALNGEAQPATGPFTFGELRARTAAGAITFDPTKTTQLFTSAGLTRQSNQGPYLKDGRTLELTLTTTDADELTAVAETIKQQWESAGVKVNLEIVPVAKLQSGVITPRRYQALLTSEIVGLDPDLYPFWHSSQAAAPGLNLSQFKNPEADRLLAEARQDQNWQNRLAKYTRLQEILAAESPTTFLYSTTYAYLMDRGINGFVTTVIGQPSDRWAGVEQWYRQTERQWK